MWNSRKHGMPKKDIPKTVASDEVRVEERKPTQCKA